MVCRLLFGVMNYALHLMTHNRLHRSVITLNYALCLLLLYVTEKSLSLLTLRAKDASLQGDEIRDETEDGEMETVLRDVGFSRRPLNPGNR